MLILADHCVFGKTIRILKEKGFDIKTLKELREQEAEDDKVIRLAQSFDAVFLTNDLDFGSIIDYPPDKYGGIIVLRIDAINEDYVNANLLQFLEKHDRDYFRGKLVVVSKKTCRVRTSVH